jgi:hypothetical protein
MFNTGFQMHSTSAARPCPPGAYDVTYDVEKTLIEFRDWQVPLVGHQCTMHP